jgi:hypothetical protein
MATCQLAARSKAENHSGGFFLPPFIVVMLPVSMIGVDGAADVKILNVASN